MRSKNYTSIDELVKRFSQTSKISPSYSKESEGLKQSILTENTEKYDRKEKQVEKIEIQEIVEHEPEVQLKNYINHRPESIKIDDNLKKAGAAQSGNIEYQSTQTIKLPISDEKVLKGLHAPIRSSFRWLAQLCMYLLNQAHITLKNVGGKATRKQVR